MSLRRRQELCLDVIEYSFSMASIAYRRVINYCRQHDKNSDQDFSNAMVLDAWSLVDVTKRLRSVLEHTPGIPKSDSLNEFLQSTKVVVNFRHHVQHIEDKAPSLAPSGWPIWGSFSWTTLHDNSKFEITTFIPGRTAKAKDIPVINPAGRKFYSDIDHFELTVGEVTINLSDISRRIELLSKRFESALTLASTRVTSSGEEILIIDLDESKLLDTEKD